MEAAPGVQKSTHVGGTRTPPLLPDHKREATLSERVQRQLVRLWNPWAAVESTKKNGHFYMAAFK
jgi:hypothetical protein